MDQCLDGWMDGWIDRWMMMDGWMERRMGKMSYVGKYARMAKVVMCRKVLSWLRSSLR